MFQTTTQVTTIFYLNHVCPANQKGDAISPTQTASIKLRSIAREKKHKFIERVENPAENLLWTGTEVQWIRNHFKIHVNYVIPDDGDWYFDQGPVQTWVWLCSGFYL